VGTSGGSRRSARNVLSLALFGLAAVIFVVVAVLYVRDRRAEDRTPPPPSLEAGHAELKNVHDVLQAQGLDVKYTPHGATIPFLPPGQGLTVDGQPLYVFIFDDPADREDQTADLDPATVVLTTPSGTPIPDGPPHLVAGSNVLVALVGGSDDVTAKVDRAIEGLP
jgi:hypothetical protein